MSREWTPGQEAGSALILAVLDAARAIVAQPGGGDLGNLFDRAGDELVTSVRMLDGLVATYLTPKPVWRAGTWREVSAGDRVRLGGQEAVAESAQLQRWHTDPRSNPRWPTPLENDVVAVRLAGREDLYRFPPSGQVEILDVAWPEESVAGWLAAAGAVLECRAMEDLKRTLGAEGVDQ